MSSDPGPHRELFLRVLYGICIDEDSGRSLEGLYRIGSDRNVKRRVPIYNLITHCMDSEALYMYMPGQCRLTM